MRRLYGRAAMADQRIQALSVSPSTGPAGIFEVARLIGARRSTSLLTRLTIRWA